MCQQCTVHCPMSMAALNVLHVALHVALHVNTKVSRALYFQRSFEGNAGTKTCRLFANDTPITNSNWNIRPGTSVSVYNNVLERCTLFERKECGFLALHWGRQRKFIPSAPRRAPRSNNSPGRIYRTAHFRRSCVVRGLGEGACNLVQRKI